MAIFRSFLVLIAMMGSLTAAVENHLKKITNKSGSHSMRNIDFIYTINLDKRPEKFESCVKQLQPYNINPYRFSAVNGWELPLDVINDCGVVFTRGMSSGHMGTCYFPEDHGQPHHEKVEVVGRTYFSHCMSRGSIAIVLSHLSILQDAYDAGYETIWVMEDDIQVMRDPRILSDLIDQLDRTVGKNGWDILFTDQDTRNNKGEYVPCTAYAWKPNFAPAHPKRFKMRKQINSEFRRIGARYGAYSMIVRRSGMKKILDFIKRYQIFLPYDMEFYLPNDIHLFAVCNDVVSTQINAPSDNGGPRYKDEKKKN